jgi:cysteine desulfurase family protein (TIGR01976 family)
MPVASLDVARVRGLYPTLGSGSTPFDAPFSTLQPESVVRAIIATLRSAPAQPGSRSMRSRRSAANAGHARRAVADLVGSSHDSVVLGNSQATLLRDFAALLTPDWVLADEVVVSRADSEQTRLPWLAAARETGAIVQRAEVDLLTGEVPSWQYEKLIGPTTRVVTVALANPVTGSVPDVAAIAEIAHQFGALVVVDAGAAVAHRFVDMAELGADVLTFSAVSIGGPTMAALVTRPGLLAELADKPTRPAGNGLERGPLPIELVDGLTAAIDHLADLNGGPRSGTRRERLRSSLAAVADYENYLCRYLSDGLAELPGVTVLGSSTERLPLLALTVDGFSPDQVGEYLDRSGISAWTGPSGMDELIESFGADEFGGVTFIGMMAYNTVPELDLLLNALGSLVFAASD